MTTLGIYSYAQNVLPASGNVGIGTASPSTELQVEGTSTLSKTIVRDSARFDGPVDIKDSVRIEKKLTVDQDLRIKGKTIVDDNFRAKSNVVVLGTTRMKGNAVAEGNFRFLGLADSTLSEERFLMIKPNGRVESMEKGGLVDLIELEAYGKECKFGSGQEITSFWKSTPNVDYGILSTGSNCPARVGIGVGNPTATLDVRGSTYLGGNTGIGIAPNNDSRLYVKQLNPTVDALTVELTSSSNNTTGVGIKTIVNNNERIAISVTNAVDNKDVFRVMGNGLIYTTEIKIRLSQDFPDYVFDEKYKLISIDSLSCYIKENKHLPNLPTANEVKENGILVGNMQYVLVEKIEELTLYLIKLNEENKQLNKRIEYLEKSK